MAFVVAESGDTPESVLKFARNFIGDTGGVSSRELTLPASTVDSLPGDVIDISFELQDALAGAQEAANNRFINKVANQFQEFRNKQSGFVSGSLAVSQFLVNAVADTETALAQSSLNPFTPLAPQPLRSNANVTLGAEIIAGDFGRVVTLGRLGSNVNASDDVFEVTRGGSTSLFRAVSKAELDDVAQFGFRPKPGGGSLETKLFATSADDAAAFGRDIFRLDRQPFTILETRIPNSLGGRLDNLILDGRSAVGVNPDLLPALNAAGRTSPLPFSPIP